MFGLFAEQTATGQSLPLPLKLTGFSVTFNGLPGALFGVFFRGDFSTNADQANVQVPWDLDVSSGKVEVRVHWEGAEGEEDFWSDPFEVNAAQASPGIFTLGTQAIVTNASRGNDDVIPGSWAQPAGFFPGLAGQPAAIGGVVTVWCNGLGPLTVTPETGAASGLENPLPRTTKTVRVFIGGVEATTLIPFLQQTSVGLNQINMVVPDGVTPGDEVLIVIEIECDDGTIVRSREDATIAVRSRPSGDL